MTQYVGLILVRQASAYADEWPYIPKEFLKKFEPKSTLVEAFAEAKAKFDAMNQKFKEAKKRDADPDPNMNWRFDGSDYVEEPLLYAVSPL